MDISSVTVDPNLGPLAARLVELGAKNAASTVATRLAAKKVKNDDKETISELEEIITSLLSDRAELQMIAQAFRDRIVGETVSAEEITYIHGTLIPLLERLMAAGQPEPVNGEEASEQDEMFQVVRSLVSAEMLTLLQLVGFNYRRAIGEPLTDVVQGLIGQFVPGPSGLAQRAAAIELELAQARREVLALEICADAEKFARYQEMFSGKGE